MPGFFVRACLGVALIAMGCGGGDDTEASPEVDCSSASVPGFMDVSAFGVCINCHNSGLSGPDRNGAPSSYNFDQYDSASEHAADIVKQVSSGFMPPIKSGYTLTAQQKEQLYAWAECGAPE